ncbi:MAG: 4-alpha-glucanotransferase [Bacteroidales bacterium]|nr:4-alpha-glucanotransferase [Bacteroidales bacterium]
MKITFKINYRTSWAEQVCVLGSIPELGSETETNAVPMTCTEDGNWELQIKTAAQQFKYYYLIKSGATVVRAESMNCHEVCLPKKKEVLLCDAWKDNEAERAFKSKAFAETIYNRKVQTHKEANYSKSIIFRVNAFRLPKNAGVMLLGNLPQLGNWDKKSAPRLSFGNDGYWSFELMADALSFPFEYKYAAYDLKTGEILFWESGDNRKVQWLEIPENALCVRTDSEFRQENLAKWKAAGVSVPVFSLRTKHDFGVGEFLDLKTMVDWAIRTGQKIIQILPINDTTITHTNLDSYPYNAISVFALHPMYANIPEIGKIKDMKLAASYEKEKAELNAKSFVDYAEVNRLKWKYFKYLYKINMAALQKDEDYQAFYQKNESWLLPYAVFCCLRDKYNTADFRQWKTLSNYNAAAVKRMARQGTAEYDDIAVHFFMQYHLHKQLMEVKHYAQKHNVVLKGDLPIGVSPSSVEAWMEKANFNTDMSAGAPPDDFSVIGQNWGFPTYNWAEMAKNNYTWWKQRFATMADYFDAYRIDHILGFFRIWEVPVDSVWGLLGHFNPALPLTVEEIEEYGVQFDSARFLKPYITDKLLTQLFGKEAGKMARNFLQKRNGLYAFKADFDTQKKMAAYCDSTPELADWKEKLLSLYCEVLFVTDPKEPHRFHPRISVEKSYTFAELDNDTKMKIQKLYVDFYYYRHNEFWKKQAMKKLPALLDTTKMMVCGEDLGMIPQSVPEVMEKLQILSLEIERMPKDMNVEFTDLKKIPYLSVCTPATHDMSPLRLWWEEDAQKSQRYFTNVLHFPGDAPKKVDAFICEHIIRNHLWSSAMWTIFQLQDWISMSDTLRAEDYAAERINEPSNPHHFWSYRIHFDIHKLVESTTFNTKLKELLTLSGRNEE